jgi:hypothetical protein
VTAEGIERIRRAKTKHGFYSAAAIAERQRFRAMFKNCREVILATKIASGLSEREGGASGGDTWR